MYMNPITEPMNPSFSRQTLPSCAVIPSASSARPVAVHFRAPAPSGMAGVGGGRGFVAQRAPWARRRLVDQPGGITAATKRLIGLPETGEARGLTIGTGVKTVSTYGLFNPQYHRDFRTWSPPN